MVASASIQPTMYDVSPWTTGLSGDHNSESLDPNVWLQESICALSELLLPFCLGASTISYFLNVCFLVLYFLFVPNFGCTFSVFPAQDWNPLATSIIARWCQCVVADFRTISGTELREPRQGKYHETSVKYRKIVVGSREMHFYPASRISATCTVGILCLRALIRWSYARLLSAYFKILY